MIGRPTREKVIFLVSRPLRGGGGWPGPLKLNLSFIIVCPRILYSDYSRLELPCYPVKYVDLTRVQPRAFSYFVIACRIFFWTLQTSIQERICTNPQRNFTLSGPRFFRYRKDRWGGWIPTIDVLRQKKVIVYTISDLYIKHYWFQPPPLRFFWKL